MSETEAVAVAAGYAEALAGIIATLGPLGICTCEPPADCGLREEAGDALRIAKDALSGSRAVPKDESAEQCWVILACRTCAAVLPPNCEHAEPNGHWYRSVLVVEKKES